MIVDSGIHVYETSTARRPWVDPERRMDPPEATGEQALALMDRAGVDGTIIVSTWSVYGTDTSYAESVQRAHPQRFRLVAPVEPGMPGVAEYVGQWSEVDGAVGIRLLFLPDDGSSPDHPGVGDAVRAAIRSDLVVNVHCTGRLDVISDLAQRFPEGRFVLDQAGLRQPFRRRATPEVLSTLPDTLALARHPNVSVKLCGVLTCSSEGFPFEDLWRPIGRIFDSFGIDRCLWGTDWQRTTHLVDYEQAVSAFTVHWPLSDEERSALMGGNAIRLYRWDG